MIVMHQNLSYGVIITTTTTILDPIHTTTTTTTSENKVFGPVRVGLGYE
jgi:hypothetical protein